MTQETFKFLGHNSFQFETHDSILVTDPWFSPKGAFFGSWFQYPKNHHLLSEFLDLSYQDRRLYIYLSHEHQDHFDLSTLEKLNKENTRILIPKFHDDYLLKFLRSKYFEVQEVDHHESMRIDASMSITMFTSDVGINHDSAVLIAWNGLKFFNQNDCKIFDQLEELKDENIDYYSVQFSGATWHPSCFAFSAKRRQLISEKKILNKLENVANGIDILKPKYYIPGAGPAIFPFLEESLSMGVDNIFIHQDYLHGFLKQRNIHNTIYLKPGDHFNPEFTSPIPPPSSEEIAIYQEGLNNPWENISHVFNKQSLLNEINLRLSKISEFSFGDTPLIIFQWGELTEDKIVIDIKKNMVVEEYSKEIPSIVVAASEKYFSLMHSGYRWQDIYLSLRAKVIRRPDVFNNIANIFIFSDIANIQDSMKSTLNISNERIEVEVEPGVTVSFARFCPHQGADLCDAKIDKNYKLKCPRHGWEFDLKNNGVNKESQETIKAEIIIAKN